MGFAFTLPHIEQVAQTAELALKNDACKVSAKGKGRERIGRFSDCLTRDFMRFHELRLLILID